MDDTEERRDEPNGSGVVYRSGFGKVPLRQS